MRLQANEDEATEMSEATEATEATDISEASDQDNKKVHGLNRRYNFVVVVVAFLLYCIIHIYILHVI